MVSLWPFRRDDNSPDSFERILSKLASQITNNTAHLAALRQRSRRFKALFTLYTVFAYILYDVLILLLYGRQNLGPRELGGILGGPVGIWGVRKLLDLYYGRRISSTEAVLEDLQTEQRATVEKLKAATKYSTTQSIIEKYGGGVPVPPPGEKKDRKGPAQPPHRQQPPPQQQQQQQQGQPPRALTPQQAAIQKQMAEAVARGIPPQFGGPQPGSPPPAGLGPLPPPSAQPTQQPASQQLLQPEEAGPRRWYDRLMDVLIGEDETAARARFALICKQCRMVNGLAPPGTRTMAEVGEWGCARCGAMNGVPKPKAKRDEKGAGSGSEKESKTEAEPVGRVTRARARKEREESVTASESEAEIKEESGEDEESAEEEEPTPKPKKGAKGKPRRKAQM